jgi:hypothetical protein
VRTENSKGTQSREEREGNQEGKLSIGNNKREEEKETREVSQKKGK